MNIRSVVGCSAYAARAVLVFVVTVVAIVLPAVDRVKPSAGKIGEVLAQKHGELLKTFPIGVFDSRQEAREWIG